MAWVLISFQQLFTPATKSDWQLYETGIYLLLEVLNQSFWVMNSNGSSGDIRIANQVDTVHHKMESMVHSHHVYKYV